MSKTQGWKKRLERNGLIACLVAFLAVYHWCNLRNPQYFHFGKLWAPTTLSVSRAGRELGRVLLFEGRDQNQVESVDYTSSAIGGVGYVLKFLRHEISPWIIPGQESPLLKLYSIDDLKAQYTWARSRMTQGYVKQVGRVIERLGAAGVDVLVVPIPTKMSIDWRHVPPELQAHIISDPGIKPGPDDPEGVYETLATSNPRHIVDLYHVFETYQLAHPDEHLYLPTDTHWTSRGITLAVGAVLDKLRENGWTIGQPSLKPAGENPVSYNTDLLGPLQLPEWFSARWPAFQWTEPLFDLVPASQRPRPAGGRLIVVGTSYSVRMAESPYGFIPLLAKVLGRPFVDASKWGANSANAFDTLKQKGVKFRKGDLLIWEMTVTRPYPPGNDGPQLDAFLE